ncbi:hypothetical protein BGZ54_009946 [Gamsiella multidivaricata]|nr:hypothetical protein BGZ54_009946 [Gamsiella multidivaricata]
MSLSQAISPEPPAVNKTTKPKRSVSFFNHVVLSADDTAPFIPSNSRLGRSSFQPGRRKGYVRKGPVGSDSEADTESEDDGDKHEEDEEDKDKEDSDQEQHSADKADTHTNNPAHPSNQVLGAKAAMRPGQNYVRKAPASSDTESDEEDATDTVPRNSSVQPAANAGKDAADSDTDSDDNDKDIGTLVRPFAHSRVSGPGQNYVRKAPVNSDGESEDEQSQGAGKNGIVSSLKIAEAFAKPATAKTAGQNQPDRSPQQETGLFSVPIPTTSLAADQSFIGAQPTSRTGGTVASTVTTMPVQPAQPVIMGISPSTGYVPELGLTMNNSSPVAPASIVNSMAVYQQQQQEMMLIMQQQQIQIATMQQQQQAYQLLVLQQQQQHQQQLQAVQMQHSRQDDDDDDDDVPLSEKKQQLPQVPQLSSIAYGQPGISPLQQPQPIFGSLPTAQFSTDQQTLILPLPLSLPHSRQASGSSMNSLNSTASATLVPQYHSQLGASSPLNLATSSPLLQPHQLHQPYQNHQYSHSLTQLQPRIPDFTEEEQEQQLHGGFSSGVAAPKLLTSSFPAGYRSSVGSILPTQHLNFDRNSVNSLHSIGSGGSGNGGVGIGSRPNSSRNSFLPQQTLIQSISTPPQQHYQQSYSPLNPHYHQTLIHVEAKPPPPQTGLVGAISAMEREKKLAKIHGTNQLQYQHQQHQQQMMISAEKERWLQEQRRLAYEAEQQHDLSQNMHLQQQLQQQQLPSFTLPDIPTAPLWTVENGEDDNRPLSGAH